MERTVLFHDRQKAASTDMRNIGLYGRGSLDHVVYDGIEPGRKFTGFSVTGDGLSVIVGPGRFYNAGKVYFRDDEGGVVLALAEHMPIVTKRIITVAVWGNEVETALSPREHLVNAETRQTESIVVATESRRHAEVNLVAGIEAVEPTPVALDANVVAVAYIVLTPEGIQSIQAAEQNRLVSVRVNANDIADLKVWRGQIGAAVDTLRSDLASIEARTRGMVRRAQFNEAAADIARLKDIQGLPDDVSSYGRDAFLDRRHSDDEHPDWLARIEEGVRFPAAQAHTAQLALLNVFEDRVKVTGGLMLPQWSPVTRLSSVAFDGEMSIAQYQHQSIEVTKKSRAQLRARYGQSFLVCTNAAWWQSGKYDAARGVFTRDGANFIVEVTAQPHPNAGTFFVRVTQYWEDWVDEDYTEIEVETETVAGSFLGQTFLNAQAGWLTAVNLYFTKVAQTGNVRLLLAEVSGGHADLDKVIADVTVDVANIKVAPLPTVIPIGPVHLKRGRYALVPVSSGNHFLAVTNGNKFAEGNLSHNLNEFWFVADPTKDLAFALQFAEFQAPRAEVQLQPLTLENGIANIDLLVEAIRPSGTELFFEVQIAGNWRRLDEGAANLLNGLPALLPFRAVFVGSTDDHAGIQLGAPSTAYTWRPRTDFQHVSETRVMPAPVDTVEVRVVVEHWDEERHTLDIALLTGETFATEVAADSVEERELPPLNGVAARREFRALFDLSGGDPIDEYKIFLTGETDNALITFHGAERVDLAWAV